MDQADPSVLRKSLFILSSPCLAFPPSSFVFSFGSICLKQAKVILMWFLLCTPVALGLLFLSPYSAELVESGSQAPQKHRKETQGEREGHLTTPVTLYVHEQLLLQSGQIAKAFQEQPAAETRSGRNTGLEVRENREQILHCSLPPCSFAPWHSPHVF